MSRQKARYFGTDGIRGRANAHPVTADFALRLGRSAASVLGPPSATTAPLFIVGRDTRQSGPMLEAALAAGLASAGASVELAGVVPTPAVAVLVQERGAAAGVVISASHNPHEDNGIKFFQHEGYKLDDSTEEALEVAVDAAEPAAGPVGTIRPLGELALDLYLRRVLAGLPPGFSLGGLRVAVDCANGAAFRATPEALQRLGADLRAHHLAPDGVNINAGCGSTFPAEICRLTVAEGAAVGISHDGDADRVLLCDETGSLLDGDEILALAALDLLRRDELAGRTLVATVMSNLGLDAALRAAGGRVVRTGVGDREVIAEMRRGGFSLGGEQSGHLIFARQSTTGDGLVAALQVLRLMVERDRPLSALRGVMTLYPQAQRNLRVSAKPPLESLTTLMALRRETEAILGPDGRVLLRYSGTEPKLRVLVEGPEAGVVERQADLLAAEVDRILGPAAATPRGS